MALSLYTLSLLLVLVSNAVTDDTAALVDCLLVNINILRDLCSDEGIPCFSTIKIRHYQTMESAVTAFAKRSCRQGYNQHEMRHIFCCQNDNCRARCMSTPLSYQPKRERHYSYVTY